MGYFGYYLAFMLLAYATEYPWLLGGIVVVWLLRRYIPDPWVYLRTFGHIRRLRRQIEANPANVTARRDLARMYLERMRPGAALTLLDQARERHPDDPELLYLTGLARHRSGKHEEALEPLVRAVEVDPRVSFGEAYRVAGDALTALKRHEEAVDAYDRFVHTNTSSIEGFTKLAIAHNRLGEKKEAQEALDEARSTWDQIPGYKRRKELGWFLRAQVYRLFV